ncbi:MAG: sigma-54-dependent Fis family transcriptional regulator [Acidobacteriota bacterium]
MVREPTDFFYSDATRVAAALPQQLRIARDLNVLLRVSTELQGLRSLEELGERVVRAVAETVDAQRVSMLARDSGIETLTEVATASDSGEWTPQDTVLDQVVTERVGLLWEGGDLSVVCTPVVGHDGVVAVLYGESDTPTSFDNQDLELFGGMTGIASLALEGVEHVRWLERENQRLRAQQLEHDLVGESPGIRRLLDLVGRVARADTTVLIRGESGTGKELVARAIHRSSARGDGPFVAINCATLSETLLESELFGHEKGSFTGAIQRQVGKLEAASGGTLFLDEVGEIPAGLQAKLLRVLQERQFERIGGTRPIHADVRVVAATNRDLENAVQDGSFRDDLYFRLKVIQLDVPALRHRRGDIPLLTRHFLALHGRRLGRRGVTVSPATRRCLVGYGWPGNVRELGNVVERALVLGETDVIHPADLPGEVVDGAEEPVGQLQEAVVEAKKSAVLRAYRDTGGDYSAAADVLGIHVNSLHRMIARLGLKDRLAAAG